MVNSKIATAISLTSLGIVLSGTSVFANAEMGEVIASTLNIRSGPSTDNSIIGYVHRGDKLQILGKSNGWYKVKLSNGKIGWGSGNYIELEGSQDIGNKRHDGKLAMVTADALNVRSGPSTSYAKITFVYKGQSVEIIESSNGWHKIKTSDGQIGWASGKYISKTDQLENEHYDNSKNPVNNTDLGNGIGIVGASALNVRSGPSIDNPKISMLYNGQKVSIIRQSNGWYNIKDLNGQTGWVSSKYINVSEETTIDKKENNSLTNSTESIVSLAKSQLGKPYVWGAEGPSSFDCSGLVYYVYGQKGINMPRTSREQANVGTTISQSQLQPGDLLFASTDGSGNVNHVGIYIGNGQMIHAPKPGDVVKTTNINIAYWQNTYVVAKRIL